MIASRTAALTGAAACGNDSVVRDILRPQREGQVRERTDGVGVDSREPTSGRVVRVPPEGASVPYEVPYELLRTEEDILHLLAGCTDDFAGLYDPRQRNA